MWRQTARPDCVNKARQLEAVRSQVHEDFAPLAAKGFAVEALGEPLAALVVLLVLKTAIDLGLWVFGGTPGAKDGKLAQRLQL